jgi:ABC-type branched-subunit amino acid transport system substrate-binding protein
MIVLSTKFQSLLQMNQEKFDKIFNELPPKRKEVLRLLLKRRKNQEIATSLDLPIGAVGTHISWIYKDFFCSKNHGNCYPRDALITLFCKFKRDWVSFPLRKKFDRIKTDEFLDIRNIISDSRIEKGIEYINKCKYHEAISLLENAKLSDPSDPIPQIYLNNARACLQGSALRVAVVVSCAQNYFHEDARNNVLRGISDAQTQFNEHNGKNGRLLEVLIVDDQNQPERAREVAQKLSDDKDILGIIGHHSGEGTQAALPIYENSLVPVISPSSTSSKLKSRVFFRTVGSTKAIASKYAQYIRKNLNLDRVVVIFHKNNEFSETLKKDFEKTFKAQGGQFVESISNINDNCLDIKKLIKDIETKSKAKAVFVISSIETNSVALAIARENNSLPPHRRLQLLFSTALTEMKILEKGGNALDGVILAHPALSENSDYMKQARARWEQQEINWRVATSYDAIQSLIEAIRLSTKPTREKILNHLEVLSLPVEQTSGFGLNWSESDYHSNNKRKYCISRIIGKKFETIIES